MRGHAEKRYPPIADYGLIGDCRSAALVSRTGSIDWLCWPQFDSPFVFARILDWDRGGFYSIHPRVSFETERSYEGETNVLVTTFTTENGKARLIDLMPALPDHFKRSRLSSFRSIIRRIEGISGTVPMQIVYVPRYGYGARPVDLRNRGAWTIYCSYDRHSLYLRSTIPLSAGGTEVRAAFDVGEGEQIDFNLAYADAAPAVLPPVGPAASDEIEATLGYWRSWTSMVKYDGKWGQAVKRSALVLKLLCFAPSGAIVAAPTTSLPEWIGGMRNWDYRYCWLRDASFTVRTLYDLGCHAEADSYVGWLLHATRLTHPRLAVLYDVFGETRLYEQAHRTLEGYRRSRPVRTGNDACRQIQIDVYGEIMNAIEHHYAEGRELDRAERTFARGIADYVSDHWMEPDHGIWEQRAEQLQHIHGKVMCWSALRSALRLCRENVLSGDASRWESEAKRIRSFVLDRGWNEEMQSFVRAAGAEELDASALTFPMIGFIDGRDPRMKSTIESIRRRLSVGDLVYRYRHEDDGIGGEEGAFLACSFWLVSALAEAGEIDEAERMFDSLLGRANDLGLYSEEIDPNSGELLGNFPQALTHIALVNAALHLDRDGRTSARGGIHG